MFSEDLGSLPGMPGMSHPCDIDSTRATLGDSSPSTISLSSLMNADDGTDENDREIGSEQAMADNAEERQEDFEEMREIGEWDGNEDTVGTTRDQGKCGDCINEVQSSEDSVVPVKGCFDVEGSVNDVVLGKDEGSLDGSNKDSVISSGGHSHLDRDMILDKFLESAEGPLAISSPVASSGKDQDSGVYTAEDLFRDMLVKRGKGKGCIYNCRRSMRMRTTIVVLGKPYVNMTYVNMTYVTNNVRFVLFRS